MPVDKLEPFKDMTKAELDSLPYDVYKWNCCCKNCNGYTTIRDYGVAPHYLLNRNSKGSQKNPMKYWQDLEVFSWFCSKHWKYFKRLGGYTMFEKYADSQKPKLGDFIKKVNSGNEKIE